MKELGSAAQQSIPIDLPFIVADYWGNDKGGLIRKFTEVLRSAPVAISGLPVLNKIVADCQRALRRKLPRRYAVVDPLPASATEEVVARLARYNMRPVFLPGVEVSETLKLRDWVKPPVHFYQWLQEGKIAKDAATLRNGWYAADSRILAGFAATTVTSAGVWRTSPPAGPPVGTRA